MEDSPERARCCKLCSFRCNENYLLLKHLFEAHSGTKGFSIDCPIDGCRRTFTQGSCFSSILSHANRKHQNWRDRFEQQRTVEPFINSERNGKTQPSAETDITEEQLDSSNNACIPGIDECRDTFAPPNDSRASAGKFLLTLKERHRLSQTAISFTIESVRQLITHISGEIKESASVAGVNISSEALDPFRGLDTEYLQTKFYQEHFGLVEPVTIELGTQYCYQKRGTKRRLVEKKDTYQYVPFHMNLLALLQNKDVYQEVIKSHIRTDGLLGDVCDGALFKSHPLFERDQLALQILMYFDEVEVVNPLGAHRGVHKLGLFYYVLGNIHPKYRSSLKAIQLIAVITNPLLMEYGFEKVLEPFINDVNKLTEGVDFVINGNSVSLKGAVLLMLADTPAAHAIGGFKVGVGFALRKCRHCMATKETLSSMFREQDFLPRTPVNYDYHCSLLDGCLAQSDSTTYGVNFRSPLNNLKYFHVANSQLPQDVMHVLLEGVVQLELSLLLQYLINSQCFSVDLLNERIDCFHYTPNEKKNKPSAIRLSGSFHQSAEQTWILAIYLPLLIGDKVPEEDEKWECFLLLLDILQICTSRVTSEECSHYLSSLIIDHHQQFQKCYPLTSITPKFHYMVHFPKQILRTGPLVSSWCMRMEAKHNYFKMIAKVGNFKNIAYSLAHRHQRLLCSYLQEDDFFSRKVEIGPVVNTTSLSDESECCKVSVLQVVPPIPGTLVKRTKWMKFAGYTYQPSLFVLTCFQPDDLPMFSRIDDLLFVNQEPFLCVTEYFTEGIDHHFHSYVIQCTNRKGTIHLSSLPEPRPTNSHCLGAIQYRYITLRSQVLNEF